MTSGKRIVLATHGTLGDLHPYLAIAIELQKRGHKPVIATSEYHRQKIAVAGVEFHPLEPDIWFDDKELLRRMTEPRRGLERIIREFILPVLRSTYVIGWQIHWSPDFRSMMKRIRCARLR